MDTIENMGLVLEGGGMRGVFTSGVLDNFMDRGIRFPYIIGVSAGACNALSYMSGQRGRAKKCNIDLLEKYRYIGFRHLLLKGNLMDFELLFHDFPERIIPYDYKALAENKVKFEIVTTSCKSGKACYYEEKDNPARLIDIIKASSSLPFIAPIAYVDGEPMMDGGVSDSIPILRARNRGYAKNVVVLTRNKGYRKPDKRTPVPFFMYRKYPELRSAIQERNAMYNKQIELIEEFEERGEVIVLRPEKPIEVGRMERDTRKLLSLYEEGYNCAARTEFAIKG